MKEVIVLGNTEKAEIEGYRADEIALGSLPNIKLWFEGDARVYNTETKQRFDRFSGEYKPGGSTSIVAEIRNKMLINTVASDVTDTTTPYDTIPAVLPNIVPDEFTYTVVGRRLRSDKIVYYAGGTFSDSDLVLRVGADSLGRLSWWAGNGSAPLILSATSTVITEALTKPHIITVTHSVGNGCKMFLNGSIVASAPAHVLVLNNHDLQLFSLANLAQGHIMLFDKDFSQTESNLIKMHNILKAYYNIM